MPPAPRDDDPDSLAARLGSGDGAALTEAYRAYRTPLVGYARRITGDAALAHDVVHDVFVALWERRGQLTVDVSLQALLYTMTRNRALNVNRQRDRLDLGTGEEDRAGSAEPGADADVHAADLAAHLRRWIEALPPRRGEAFALSRFDGLSHAEIAEVMGLSVRTVNTHVLHALQDLRRRLDALEASRPTPSDP